MLYGWKCESPVEPTIFHSFGGAALIMLTFWPIYKKEKKSEQLISSDTFNVCWMVRHKLRLFHQLPKSFQLCLMA